MAVRLLRIYAASAVAGGCIRLAYGYQRYHAVQVAVVVTGVDHAPKGDYHTRRILGWSTHNVADWAVLELKAISSMSELGLPRMLLPEYGVSCDFWAACQLLSCSVAICVGLLDVDHQSCSRDWTQTIISTSEQGLPLLDLSADST